MVQFFFWYNRPSAQIAVRFGGRMFYVKHLYVFCPTRSVWEPIRESSGGPTLAITGSCQFAYISKITPEELALELRDNR